MEDALEFLASSELATLLTEALQRASTGPFAQQIRTALAN
jgi:hypothetical protein